MKIFISLFIFLTPWAMAQADCPGDGTVASLNCGLAAYWNLDQGSGTTANDSSGNGNNGTLKSISGQSADLPQWVTGSNIAAGTGALSFDGQGKVDVGTMSALNGATTASWSFWVRPSAQITAFTSFLSKYNTGGGSGTQSWFIGTGNGSGTGGNNNVAIWFSSNTVAWNKSGNLLFPGTWYHIVVLYNGAQKSVQLYINNTLQNLGVQGIPSALPTVSTEAYIGSTANNVSSYNGIIDDVRVYNRVLSTQDIQSLYQLGTGAGASVTPAVPINLVASNLQDTQVTISWSTPTGAAAAAAGYNVYRNGTLIGTTTLMSYIDNLIAQKTNYLYTVAAYNGQGASQLVSAPSVPLSVTTPPSNYPLTVANNKTEAGEACDGTDLNGYTCATVAAGYASGTLACKTDRSGYDVSKCVPGKTITAVSCSQADVQTAINSASDGDTVLVPAGVCTWIMPVVISGVIQTTQSVYNTTTAKGTTIVLTGTPPTATYPPKSIILKGAGIDTNAPALCAQGGTPTSTGTVICDKVPTNLKDPNSGYTVYPNNAIAISTVVGKPVRVTGFSFDGNNNQFIIGVSGPVVGAGPLFRVDHNAFTDLPLGAVETNALYGLVDHNSLITAPGHGSTAISINGDFDAAWARPLTLGSEDAVYMEDNSFIFNTIPSNGSYDAYQGARYVLRYNNINETWIGHHGFDSGTRGTFSWEIYNNRSTSPKSPGESRSGTGVVFNNLDSVDGNKNGWNWYFTLRNYRSSDWARVNYGFTFPLQGNAWNGVCDGTTFLTVSIWSAGYANYKVNDVLNILQTALINNQHVKVSNGTGATVKVTGVNQYGQVTSVVPMTTGNGYTPYSTGLETSEVNGTGYGALIGIGMDGNTPGMEGYPCEDQNGRSTLLNADGTISNQALAPVYAWNNNEGGTLGGGLRAGGYNNNEFTSTATSVSNATIGNGGANYKVGDVLNIIQGGNTSGDITVLAIDANGTITSIQVTGDHIGTGYTDATGVATSYFSPTPGTGSGATVNIITPQIITPTVGNKGSGYQVNDVLNIIQPGAYHAAVTVLAVDGSGGITSLEETPDIVGTGYTNASNLATSYLSNTGIGAGATVNITVAPVTVIKDRTLDHIIEGRDFYNCDIDDCSNNKYVPYPYPHPWVQMDTPASSEISGDVNNDNSVTIADAELAAQAAMGIVTNLNAAQLKAAEVSSSTETKPTIYDAFLIAEYVAGLITKFPVQP
jgi:hypothetical protein